AWRSAPRRSNGVRISETRMPKNLQRPTKRKTSKLAEGVGFEPTVGYPTLDFESSALNRTQPPFLGYERKLRTVRARHGTSPSDWRNRTGGQRPTSNAECNLLDVGHWALGFEAFPFLS